MTRKLTELFELADTEQNSLNELLPNQTKEVTIDALNALDKIEAALPQVKGLEAGDSEMDELAQLARDSYKDLIDLGMQVEARFSADIFNSASTFLGHAITAKTAKLNKSLKMIELQLRKAAVDAKKSKENEELDNMPLGSGKSIDRNELISILKANSDKK
jgi:hypothetical protein